MRELHKTSRDENILIICSPNCNMFAKMVMVVKNTAYGNLAISVRNYLRKIFLVKPKPTGTNTSRGA